MRNEIRSVVSEAMNGFHFAPAPTEIDAADVIMELESVKDVMKRMEVQHRDNKTAIRLASIQKEGNKQHFLDMVEVQEKLEVAAAAMKHPRRCWWTNPMSPRIRSIKRRSSCALGWR
jgi:hypothetical protein